MERHVDPTTRRHDDTLKDPLHTKCARPSACLGGGHGRRDGRLHQARGISMLSLSEEDDNFTDLRAQLRGTTKGYRIRHRRKVK
jgi:hypothetical protein